jgi:hypothetical protein
MDMPPDGPVPTGSGPPRADWVAVGLGETFRPEASFTKTFGRHFAPRLEKRAATFRVLFGALLDARPEGAVIVETGCLRQAGNWQGDGQSTIMFDALCEATAATCISVDVDPASIACARSVCSGRVQLVANDSVTFFTVLRRLAPALRIDLLYLDSFDLDHANPMPSALHHMKELTAAMPLLPAGALVCVDDCVEGGGKDWLVADFLDHAGAVLLADGYQKIWRLR